MNDPEPPPLQLDEPAAAPPRRSPRRLAAVGVAAVLAVGAGAFGISAMNEPDGPESPEAAVEAFFAAVDDEDVIGVLESVEPDERAALRRALEGGIEQTDRAEITQDVDLRDVSGVDLAVSGLAHTTERFTDDVAGVDLTGGTVDAGVALADLPFGRTVSDVLGAGTEDPEAATIDLAGLRVMTVSRGGAWYVSAAYTAAEAIRRDTDPEPALPTFGSFAAGPGADSPEDAVRNLATAIDEVDVAAMIATTSPTRGRVLHDYGPTLVEAVGETDPESTSLTDLTLTAEPEAEGTTVVTVTGYELSFGSYGETITHRLADGCITTTFDYTDDPEYPQPDDLGYPQPTNSCEVGPMNARSFWFTTPFGVTGETASFVTVEEDGRWYIDPVESLAELLVGSLRESSVDELRDLAHFWTGAVWLTQPDEFWEACGVDRPAPDVGLEVGWDAMYECERQLPADYDGPRGFFTGWYGGPSSIAEGSEAIVMCEPADELSCENEILDPSVECAAVGDNAAVATCIEDLAASGQIPPQVACYAMPDEATEDACWRDGVAAGTIDELELAYDECEADYVAAEQSPQDADEAMAAYEACIADIEND